MPQLSADELRDLRRDLDAKIQPYRMAIRTLQAKISLYEEDWNCAVEESGMASAEHWRCYTCSTIIFEGEMAHVCSDGEIVLCDICAPSYQDLIDAIEKDVASDEGEVYFEGFETAAEALAALKNKAKGLGHSAKAVTPL